MSELVLIHFSPVELYPPVQNALKVFVTRTSEKITVFTTKSRAALPIFDLKNNEVTIIRAGTSGQKLNTFARYFGYFWFNTVTLVWLVFKRPGKILYYETLSAFPVFIYKTLVNKNCKVFIHYHEYLSPAELKTGMRLVRIFHRLEKHIYGGVDWISQTNRERMDLFKENMPYVLIKNDHILPNYPPNHWRSSVRSRREKPVRIIYVGSLSLTTMYTREFAEFVNSKNGEVVWEIYSHNFDEGVPQYFAQMNSPFISLKSGIDYEELPKLLRNYQVGVILYKGHIPNFVHNAPNKLFEYLTCGLDVWFPTVMKGSLRYTRTNSYPKVIALDFELFNQWSIDNLLDKEGLVYGPFTGSCEEALQPLVDAIFSTMPRGASNSTGY